MDFSFIKADFATINAGGFDALQFSIVGMAIVFGGLTLLAVYIALLPMIMSGFSRLKDTLQMISRNRQDDRDATDGLDDEALIAVATALHLHQFCGDENRKITWKRHDLWDSSWQRAGRFEAMNNQGRNLAPRR